jgi:hypothetical protein
MEAKRIGVSTTNCKTINLNFKYEFSNHIEKKNFNGKPHRDIVLDRILRNT